MTASTSVITTIAGNGSTGYSGDGGQATAATVQRPHGINLDSAGNIYIGDHLAYNVIRKITISSGIISTIAGIGSTSGGYDGDNIQATAASLFYPIDVMPDSYGNLFICDQYNFRIRKIDASTGLITTVVGTGAQASSGDGSAATSAAIKAPCYSRFDGADNLYISECEGNRIRKVVTVTTEVPTATPSTSPSTLQPSLVPSAMPSCTPTLSPSAYPTYASSVRVYFTVTQGFVGISASTYSSNKESNDALFKQTVASMLGYNSKKEEVTIQLVTDAAQRRSLSATSQECEVVYSITTHTSIFNNTNHATAMFIESLNESISTGAFDTLLHSNSGSTSSWQSTTTDYVIFGTASPTSSPTSIPTLAPTKRDNVVANLLTVPLDAKVAKVKIKYYLGAFMGYFLAIYICLYLYSFLRYGKLTATQLYDTSYQSDTHVTCSMSTATSNESKHVLLSDLLMNNALVQSNMLLEEKLKLVKQASSKKGKMYAENSGALVEEEDKYSKGYREYMHQQRTLLGCSACLYPEGCVVKAPCTSKHLVFPPGRIEDILLYICHNHSLFSCFYFTDGSKRTAHASCISARMSRYLCYTSSPTCYYSTSCLTD